MKRHEKIWRLQNSQGAWKHAKCNTLSLIIYHRLPKLKIWLQRLKKPHKIATYRLGNHTGKKKHTIYVSLADFCF